MSGIFDNPAFQLLGVVVLAWFAIRFFVKPKRGASGIAAMFRKEKAAERRGMGRKAIAGLLEDVERLVAEVPRLRGAILIGAFAADMATPKSRVEIILLAEETGSFLDTDSLSSWAYPRRGHDILAHDILAHDVKPGDDAISHQFRLRGAPQVVMHIVRPDRDALPPVLAALMAEGAVVVSTGLGASAALERWKKARG